ncbi:LysE family transporter [Desulfocurvibacter africanus]|uniref:LysE family transporter n=1 Tax=Desulfocurvibacter africanus TaxID=873 RepID=UPI002FD96FA8
MFPLFFKGLVIGFSIAAPVGPIGILCIRRTLVHGRLCGFLTGLGAATADAFYGLLAALGLASLSGLASGWGSTAVRLGGGLFLLWLAWATVRPKPAGSDGEPAATRRANGLFGAYATALLLTLTNPMTIMSFAGIFAGLGLSVSQGSQGASVMVAGVFAGSCLWWLLLSGGTSLFGSVLADKARWIDLASSFVLAVFGLAAVGSILGGQ